MLKAGSGWLRSLLDLLAPVMSNNQAAVGTISPSTTDYTIQPGALDGAQFAIMGNQVSVGNMGLDYEAGATRTISVMKTIPAVPFS